MNLTHFRRNHRKSSVKKGVLKKFHKIHKTNTCAKVSSKKRLGHRYFLVNVANVLRTSLQNTSDECLCHFMPLISFSGVVEKFLVNPLSAIPTKWSNTLTQFVGNLPTNCLRVYYHFVGMALKGLSKVIQLCFIRKHWETEFA